MSLFSYVISTLELMVAEDYMIVYLNGATPHRRMPGLGWLKKCYQMIDRRFLCLISTCYLMRHYKAITP